MENITVSRIEVRRWCRTDSARVMFIADGGICPKSNFNCIAAFTDANHLAYNLGENIKREQVVAVYGLLTCESVNEIPLSSPFTDTCFMPTSP